MLGPEQLLILGVAGAIAIGIIIFGAITSRREDLVEALPELGASHAYVSKRAIATSSPGLCSTREMTYASFMPLNSRTDLL